MVSKNSRIQKFIEQWLLELAIDPDYDQSALNGFGAILSVAKGDRKNNQTAVYPHQDLRKTSILIKMLSPCPLLS